MLLNRKLERYMMML